MYVEGLSKQKPSIYLFMVDFPKRNKFNQCKQELTGLQQRKTFTPTQVEKVVRVEESPNKKSSRVEGPTVHLEIA